ncbi:auxin-induced protein 10A5-like [Salvia divinorum]|uniref:Auxin-induced protein 10A5-like n=1 Tax=Salvia divinorum TaxID=28513 RepID=A0ABD1GG42_SALDI
MPKARASVKEKNGGFLKLKIVVKMLQKSLIPRKKWVPEDVKEGHFAVMAVEDDDLKRFVLPLSFLTRPSFLRLLEQAEEEYGFGHHGALTLPCSPTELEGILAEQWPPEGGSNDAGWGCYQTVVKTC